MIRRRRTRVVKVGRVKIGGKNPIVIQSMAKTDTRDVKATVRQIKALEKAGCEIVRVAVKDKEAAECIRKIRSKIHIPLVADIHFDYRLALLAMESGADKVRVNPGNMRKEIEFKKVIRAAKKYKVPIRIGLNSGSLETKDKDRVSNFVKTALRYVKICQAEDFHDILISLKSSNIENTVKAYKTLALSCNYPFHIGITASGPRDTGIIKSSIGIGALLLDGLGDTIRVSLTADPLEEVLAAKGILQALNLRNSGPNIISCPTCGRCQVGLRDIVREFESRTIGTGRERPITVAIMGCEVNGPGEAKEADVGVAFGRGSGLLFRKGKVIKKIQAKNATRELIKLCAGHKH